MWTGKTKILVNERKYWFDAKVYDQPSAQYGVSGGRISKFWVTGDNGDTIADYDRGWKVFPVEQSAMDAVNAILEKYN